MTLADRIVLLRDGHIEQEGAPLDLFERPKTRFVAGFLGSPQMNFIGADLVRQDDRCAVRFGDGTQLSFPPNRSSLINAAGADGRQVVFGVRPEHISPSRDGDRRRDGQFPLKAKVDLVQPTGSRLYIQFRLGDTEVTAELQAHDVEQPGSEVELLVDMDRTILIDPQTDQVIQE